MLELNPENQNGIVGAGVTANALKASRTEVVPTADDRQLKNEIKDASQSAVPTLPGSAGQYPGSCSHGSAETYPAYQYQT